MSQTHVPSSRWKNGARELAELRRAAERFLRDPATLELLEEARAKGDDPAAQEFCAELKELQKEIRDIPLFMVPPESKK